MSVLVDENPNESRTADADIPLVVDLDGTLIHTDLLVESAFEVIGRRPLRILSVPLWLMRGRAALKSEFAQVSTLDVTTLPYNGAVLAEIQAARNEGRRVILASAADARFVREVSEHLGCFDAWYASDGETNLSRTAKANKLIAAFGEAAFDYIGNGRDDLPVWEKSRLALVAASSPAIIRSLNKQGVAFKQIGERGVSIGQWFKMLRPHQWSKNALVFIPLLTAHVFSMRAVLLSWLAFASFSLCASAIYILNDAIDVKADRQHPSKKKRPFAAGTVPLAGGLMIGAFLFAVAMAIAIQISWPFVAVLAGYAILTTAYSLLLKRKMLIDTITLAALYTIRVIGGAVAIEVVMSQWLFAFAMFMFLSLAMTKRYSELALRLDAGLPDPSNRNYRISDLPVISSIAAASGFSAVIVFSLYLSSDTVQKLYRHPKALWLICPLLIYWISRMLMLSHRRLIEDDPVLFAIKDRISLLVILLIGVVAVAAI